MARGLNGQGEFTLNFNNVDVRTFIKFVSEFTKENYVLDPNVKGNITVYSQRPVAAKDIDKVFRAILNLYGFAIIKKGDISEIIQISDGKIRSGEITVGKVPPDKYQVFLNQVVPLKHYQATTLVQILNPYLTKGGQITADDRSNALIISDIGINTAKLMEIIEKIDIPAPQGKEEFKIYRLENASSEEVAKTLNEILSKKKSVPVGRGATAAIQPSVVSAKASNSLIIYADPDDFKMLERLVKELDIMANQVLIEALIAEVTYGKIKDIGIEWNAASTFNNDKYTGTASTNFNLNTAITDGLQIAITKGITDIGGLIKLYGQDSRFNILATPQIVTADNSEASINVSQNVPYLKSVEFLGTYVSGTTGDTNNTIKSFDYKDVGIKLKLTPQISRDKYIKLKIAQEVSKVLSVGTDGQITTAKREADTTLIIPNGQTVVLGGLISTENTKTVDKVPFLGDIPLVGYLFRHQRDDMTKTNLLLFITPPIISSPDEAERIRKEKDEVLKSIRK